MARYRCFCRHLHLPVQHGSDRILRAMNRRYSRVEYLALAGALRAAMPDISLSTDIMVGFPGETEEDMAALFSLMEETEFSRAYMYHYNVREGTAAARLPGRIPYALKIERLSRVIALQKKLTMRSLRSRLGVRERVLVEGISRKNADEYSTRTEKDDTAVLTGVKAKPGTFVELIHQSLRGTTFRSVMEEPCPGV
jgi:tRNA-2-methylthio-N6-dimethylallyladenosine synthase